MFLCSPCSVPTSAGGRLWDARGHEKAYGLAELPSPGNGADARAAGTLQHRELVFMAQPENQGAM